MRSRGLSVPQNRPHPDRQGLDFSQAGEGLGIELGFIQEEELGLRRRSRQRIARSCRSFIRCSASVMGMGILVRLRCGMGYVTQYR
jgi:hypothetical protein